MKRYLNRQSIFAVMFIVMLFSFSITNVLKELPQLKNTLKEFKTIKNVDNLKEKITKVDDVVNSELLWKLQFVESYGYLQVLMGKKEFNNFSYIKDDNGFINYASLYKQDDPKISEYAKRILRLKKSVEKEGTKVMFISPPSKNMTKFSKFSEELEVNDHNSLQDKFLLELFSKGIDYLDLREPLLKSNLAYDKMFYKTDHHWTSQAAFVSFGAIVEKMNQLYGLNLDSNGYYRDLKNYNEKTYKNDLLGSQGRNTGINYSGLDDFTLIWPKFETDFVYENKNRNGKIAVHKEGNFQDSLLNLDALKHDSDIYAVSSYTSYVDDIKPWDKIVNKKNPNGPKILMIRDSFSNPMISFLAPLCSEIDMIWPLTPDGKVNVEQYLKKNKFDYVFVMLYPGNINEEGINFFKK